MKSWAPERPAPSRDCQAAIIRQRTMLRCCDFSRSPGLVIGIPVCNERERIVACVDALAATLASQAHAGVVLLVYNSDDASARKGFLALRERGVTAIVVGTTLAPDKATAGWARRLALTVAARWALPDAVLMTTDADGRVAPDWAEANLALLQEGAHLVCGRIAPYAAEAALLPSSIAGSDAIESDYTSLLIELDARLDPRHHDPWPHRGLASGASLAVKVSDYRAVGGMPPLACSEDRAFPAVVEKHGRCVRHSDAPLVTVSRRLQGRARGGMADAIAARIADPDSLADQRLLPAAITARRATLRQAVRAAWRDGGIVEHLTSGVGVSAPNAERIRRARTFGALWEEVVAGAETLAARRMRPSDLARELPEFRRLVDHARSAP